MRRNSQSMPVNEHLLHNWFYGNLYVRTSAAIGFAFLMGSIPLGPLARWLFRGLDPRMFSTACALVPVLNALKALVPTLIALHGGGRDIGLFAALAAVLGHCYSPWLRGRGGTGVAVEFGALCALSAPAAAIFFVTWLVGAVSSNYATVGSLFASTFAIVALWLFLGPYAALYGVAAAALVASRHHASFVRLRDGVEEPMRAPAAPQPVREGSAPLAARTPLGGQLKAG